MNFTIIGTGLIGGSMALTLKEKGIASRVIGVESNAEHAQKALDLALVDEILPLEQAIPASELVILAVPVNVAEQLLPSILDMCTIQVVMDVGSTKEGLLSAVSHHPKRGRLVATHPMWGTEYSGPGGSGKRRFCEQGNRNMQPRNHRCGCAGKSGTAVQVARYAYRIYECKRP